MGKMNYVGVIACLCVLSGTSLAGANCPPSSENNSSAIGAQCLNTSMDGGTAQLNAHNEAEIKDLSSPAPIGVHKKLSEPPLKPSDSVPIVNGSNYSSRVPDSGGDSHTTPPLVSSEQKPTNETSEIGTSTPISTTASSPISPTTETTTNPSPTPTTTPSPATPPTKAPPTPPTNPPTSTTTTTSTPVTTTTSTTPSTTVSPTSPSSSTAPTTTAPTKAPTSTPESDRRFDGPSFIGGIVFALGVTAIGFIAWKFYKARTERNYHTL